MPNKIDFSQQLGIDQLNQKLIETGETVDKLTKKVENLLKAGKIDMGKDEIQAAKVETEKLRQEILKLNATQKQLQIEAKKTATAEKEAAKAKRQNANELRQLEKNIKNLTPAQKERLKLLQQEKLAQSEMVKTFKAQATVMNTGANAYERLKAEQQLLANRALKLAAAFEYQKRTGKLSEEQIMKWTRVVEKASVRSQDTAHSLTRMEQATGKMTARTMGSYPAVFSFSQVMREMPNFAMSARIGFMSLSNNIPMLADDFKRLTKEIDANTGKMLGSKGALKILAKELVGFNAIVILATTLVVMYADELGEWASELFSVTRELGSAESALRAFNEEQGKTDGAGAALRKDLWLTQGVLEGTIDKVKGFTDEQKIQWVESERALGLFKSTLENLLPKAKVSFLEDKDLSNLEKAEKALKVMEELNPKLISAANARAAAEKKLTDASEEQAELDKERTDFIKDQGLDEEIFAEMAILSREKLADAAKKAGVTEKEALEAYGRTSNYFKSQLSWWSNTATQDWKELRESLDAEMGGISKIQERYLEKAGDMLESEKKITELRKDAGMLLAESELAFPRSTDSSKGREKQLRNIFKIESDYSHWKAVTEEENKNLEIAFAKETNEGVLNSYQGRLTALQDYYDNANKIAFIEMSMAESQARKRYEKEKSQLDDNLRKKTISATKYAEQMEIIQTNLDLKLTEIQDKYQADTNDNLRDFVSTTYDIRKDQYDREVELLEQKYDREEKLRDVAFEKEKQAIKDKYSLKKRLGGDDLQETIANIQSKSAKEKAAINDEIFQKEDQIDKLHALGKFNTEEELRLKEEITESKLDLENAYKMEAIAIANTIKDTKSALEDEIFDKAVAAAKATVDSLFQIRFDALDKESEYFKEVEDEKLEDVADRLEAGVISEKEADDEKERIKANALAEQKRIDKEEADLKRKQFFIDQAIALGQVITQMALGIASATALAPVTAGASLALIPLIKTSAAINAALILAQTIPQFEQGSKGPLAGDTLGIAGEKRDEVAVHQGKPYLIPKGAAMYRFKKGTEIYPSVDDWIDNSVIKNDNMDIERQLNSLTFSPNFSFDDGRLLEQLVALNKNIKNKKSDYSRKDYMRDVRRYRNQTRGIV